MLAGSKYMQVARQFSWGKRVEERQTVKKVSFFGLRLKAESQYPDM